MDKTFINLVEILLNKNQIKFDNDELQFQIQSHPSYPSLHAITGVLDYFNIENIAIDVPISTEVLSKLPRTMICEVNREKGKDLAFIEKKKGFYIVQDALVKNKLTESEFLRIFTGVVLVVDKPVSPDVESKNKNTNVWYTLAIFLPIVVLALLRLNELTITIQNIVYSSLSFVGFLFSMVILKKEMGMASPIGNLFCSSTNTEKNCDDVLLSKGAEIIKGLKMSDLSIVYFTSLIISLAFTHIELTILYNISMLSLPITLYSLYYQYIIVKKWCALCLCLVLTLWLQGIVVLFFNNTFVFPNLEDTLLYLLVSSIIIAAWLIIKPFISKIEILKRDKIKNTKFKRNFTIFKNLLQTSKIYNTTTGSTKDLVFGQKEAILHLMVVTNPFCGHCVPVHKLIEKILNNPKFNIKVVIRFNIKTENEDSLAVQITSRLLELYDQDPNKCLNAMSAIYSGIKPKEWLNSWEQCLEKDRYINELKCQRDWCLTHQINFTPDILINGYKYPVAYERADLFHFIEDLEENFTAAPEMALS